MGLEAIALKILIPLVWTAVSPLVTALVTRVTKELISDVPPVAQTVISGVVGAAGAALTGDVAGLATGLDLPIEEIAAAGGPAGIIGHRLARMNPDGLNKIAGDAQRKADDSGSTSF